MTGAIVAKLAVPLILEALKSGLSEINHPAAQGASSAIGELQNAVNNGAITPEQMSHIEKMSAIEAEAQAKILESVNASLRVEVASNDPYVRRMRPTFGYMMAVTWGAQMMAIAYVIITSPQDAGAVMNGMASLGTIWAVALSVLGIYVYQRSNEKMMGQGRFIEPPQLTKKTPRPVYND
jgi:Holin of 3TMs, for gene-transfer release